MNFDKQRHSSSLSIEVCLEMLSDFRKYFGTVVLEMLIITMVIIIYIITKLIRPLWLVNQLWVIVLVNPLSHGKLSRASSELSYKNNGPHFLWVYWGNNPLGMFGRTLKKFENHSPVVSCLCNYIRMPVKYGAENNNVIEALLELTMTDPSVFTYRNIKKICTGD